MLTKQCGTENNFVLVSIVAYTQDHLLLILTAVLLIATRGTV
jgi:hypothetical protein